MEVNGNASQGHVYRSCSARSPPYESAGALSPLHKARAGRQVPLLPHRPMSETNALFPLPISNKISEAHSPTHSLRASCLAARKCLEISPCCHAEERQSFLIQHVHLNTIMSDLENGLFPFRRRSRSRSVGRQKQL